MSTLNLHPRVTKRTALSSTCFAAATVATAGLMLGAPQTAHAQEQCSTYTVVSGDRLSTIATTAGVRGGFQTLFDANTNVLENPNILEVDMVLVIPCADGSLPTSTARVTAASTGPAPTTAMPDRPLRITTGTGYAPFTDEDLPGGGMITRMVERSMELGNPDQAYNLIFINDWGSHLETLLPTGAVDMAFPWFLPNCDLVENLSEASAYRCTDFNHSEPFYEILVDFFTLADSQYAAATSHEDLFGARICRPEAWFTFDLEAERLVAPNITYVTPVSQQDCVQLLASGDVDVMTYDTLPAEEDIRESGFADRIAKIEPLSGAVSSHIFVAKDNAFANEALPIINAGLEELRLSGEWFNIVRESIQETVEN
ncbi:LysM peptidoglycan-binding domain-containing protein [Roseobacter sp. CCS2]|uniref:LysM peptidoglycan-binding domain-containing protein n=1 Tax=Roseobacter sp. CCS2 TaxID=391593 RepID=UPI0000F4059F|nr:LysM peptidoglycan-binding domain-containing protein [Roseobacter sp. CCS2]EBA11338.1 LysM domain protein [Roseobacter sp. CCS2]